MGYASPSAPQVEEAIQRVLQACLDHDVPCAITTGASSVQERIEQGFSFVTVGADGGLNANAANALQLGRETAGRSDQELGVASRFVVAPQFCFMPDQIILNIKRQSLPRVQVAQLRLIYTLFQKHK